MQLMGAFGRGGGKVRKGATLPVMVVFALVLMTGCASEEPGEALSTDTPSAGPGSETGAPGSSSTGADPTVEIPARPADLSLEGVQPCKLFTKSQLTQLSIDREPRAGSNGGKLAGPTCSLDVASKEPYYTYTAQLVTDMGIDTWLTGTRNVDAWLVSVGDYPAVDFKTKGVDDQECITTVDVAEGQQLLIDLAPLDEVDYKQLCPMSEKAAAMALQTLQSLK